MSAACSTGADIGCSETSSILANQVKFKGFAVDHVCASYSYDGQGFFACEEQRRASLLLFALENFLVKVSLLRLNTYMYYIGY